MEAKRTSRGEALNFNSPWIAELHSDMCIRVNPGKKPNERLTFSLSSSARRHIRKQFLDWNYKPIEE